jgi:hypothetical protein
MLLRELFLEARLKSTQSIPSIDYWRVLDPFSFSLDGVLGISIAAVSTALHFLGNYLMGTDRCWHLRRFPAY